MSHWHHTHLAAVLLIVACSPAEGTTSPAEKVRPAAPRSCNSAVRWCDPSLARELTVGPLTQRRRRCDRALCLRVPVRNDTGRPLRVLMQVEFLCERGLGYGDITTKRVLTLAPAGVASLEATARSCKARDFVIWVWRDEAAPGR